MHPNVQHNNLEQTIAWAKYEHEFEESMRRDGSVIRSAGEIVNSPCPPSWAVADVESAYRRGFSHGIDYAIETIYRLQGKKGFSRSTEIANILGEWNINAVYPWRYRAVSDCRNSDSFDDGHPCLQQESWSSIRRRIFQRDGHRCVDCGSRQNLHCDHIFPVARGGVPTDDNLQTRCKRCNGRKGSA